MLAILFFVVLFSGSFCSGSDTHHAIEYKCASEEDIPSLLRMMDRARSSQDDCQRVVIYPAHTQEENLIKNISERKAFVAKDTVTKQVVGYKKLFLFETSDEWQKFIAKHSFGEHVNSTIIKWYEKINGFSRISTDELPRLSPDDIILYTGADYVLPEYRGRGINSSLYQFAFYQYIEKVRKMILSNRMIQSDMARGGRTRIVLLYGLAAVNDYDHRGYGSSRTYTIAKSFSRFLKDIYFQVGDVCELTSHRYESVWPRYDEKTSQWISVKDENSALMYNNMLITDIEGLR